MFVTSRSSPGNNSHPVARTPVSDLRPKTCAKGTDRRRRCPCRPGCTGSRRCRSRRSRGASRARWACMNPARKSWPSSRPRGCSRLHNVAHDQAGWHSGRRGRSPSTGVTPGGQMRDSPRPRPPFGHPRMGAGGGGGGAPLTRPTATRAKKRLSMAEWIVGGVRKSCCWTCTHCEQDLSFYTTS
jgi:hypothetical protein